MQINGPYLSQLVGLFPLGHGGPGSERLVGLGDDAGTHCLCLRVVVIVVLRAGYLHLELLSLCVAAESRSLLFMWAGRVTGEGSRAPSLGGCYTEAKPLGR